MVYSIDNLVYIYIGHIVVCLLHPQAHRSLQFHATEFDYIMRHKSKINGPILIPPIVNAVLYVFFKYNTNEPSYGNCGVKACRVVS